MGTLIALAAFVIKINGTAGKAPVMIPQPLRIGGGFFMFENRVKNGFELLHNDTKKMQTIDL